MGCHHAMKLTAISTLGFIRQCNNGQPYLTSNIIVTKKGLVSAIQQNKQGSDSEPYAHALEIGQHS